MYTVAETTTFRNQANRYRNQEARREFIEFISRHPDAGDIVPGSGGVRKVRWAAKGKGKRGGVRVIYVNAPPAKEPVASRLRLTSRIDRPSGRLSPSPETGRGPG